MSGEVKDDEAFQRPAFKAPAVAAVPGNKLQVYPLHICGICIYIDIYITFTVFTINIIMMT